MALVAPWHSTRESDRKVYHDSNLCTEGNNGRPRCKNCEERER